MLRALKSQGHKLGLISNADTLEMAAWDSAPIALLFDSAVFSCAVGSAKPESEIYQNSPAAIERIC